MSFYANEQQPKDSVRVRIAVEKTGEGGMVDYYPPSVIPFTGRDMVKGSTQVTVTVPVMKKLRIVDHSPWEIWPYLPPQINRNGTKESRGADRPGYNPKRGFSVVVKDGSGSPMSIQQISISAKYDTGSGGHGHTGFADTGGTIRAVKYPPDSLQGIFYTNRTGRNPLLLTTDASGMAAVDSFIASQASGRFLITARLVSDTTITDTVNLQVKVPGLFDFGIGDYWNLTGNTSRQGRNHLSNHWCTQKMKDSLVSALRQFYEWTESEEGGGTAIQIGINDMCLQWGGAFDIPGTWKFSDEHSFHRVGLSVDIDNWPGDLRKSDGSLNDNGEQLKEIMDKRGGKKYKEPTIHFGFDGGI